MDFDENLNISLLFTFRPLVDKEDLKEFSEVDTSDAVGGVNSAAHQRFVILSFSGLSAFLYCDFYLDHFVIPIIFFDPLMLTHLSLKAYIFNFHIYFIALSIHFIFFISFFIILSKFIHHLFVLFLLLIPSFFNLLLLICSHSSI